MEITNRPTPKDALDAPITQTETAAFLKEHFTISDEKAANWLLAKLAGIRAEQARVTAQAKQRAEELEADYSRLFYLYSGQLEAFARKDPESRRRKTITLLQGTLSLRTSPPRLDVSDLNAAKRACPEAVSVETIERIDHAVLLRTAKAALDSTGEILPGFGIVPASETFAVKFGTGKKTE